jgi:tRNA (guanine-N7-)-methyltransferase
MTETMREAAFFGRHKGKPLGREQADRLKNLLPRLEIDRSQSAPSNLATLFPHETREIRLEIGFGGGEHLIHRALESPATGFIGVEPFVNGMAKALVGIGRQRIENIRLYPRDAIELLDWLPDASLDQILLLYPDPWPKRAHWKRRFVGDDNVRRFARVLKSGGGFHFASDIDSYVQWTLNHLARFPEFMLETADPSCWSKPYPGWIETRYEAKARREGRGSAYLSFRRL